MFNKRITSFLTLYDTMNYRLTAEKLFLTQPAITQHIHALEKEYQCTLFIYDHKQLYRTPQADQLAIYFRSILHNDKKIKMQLQDVQPLPLRIGASRTIGEFIIGPLLVNYLQEPKHIISLSVDNTEALLRKIDQQELDFALVEGDFDKQKYHFQKYRCENFVGLCAKKHPFANQEIPLANIFDNTIIVREPQSGTRAILENLLHLNGHSLSNFYRTIETNNFSAICYFIAHDIGISFGYESIADHHPELATFTLKDMPIAHDLHFVHAKNSPDKSLFLQFIKAVDHNITL